VKSTREVIDMAARLGADVEQGGKHVKIKLHGRVVAILPHGSKATSSVPGRAYKNMRAQLRRAGLWSEDS